MTRPHFAREEYTARIAKTRDAMAAREIELLFVSDPSKMAWLNGYDGWSFYVHQGVLLTQDGEPVWFGRGEDVNGAKRTTYLSDDSIVGYPDEYVQSTERHPMDYLSDVIAARGWGGARIGVEVDNYYYAVCHAALTRHLQSATYLDATGLVNWQRAVQSPAEIDCMRTVARIAGKVQARILDRVEPGLRKCDLVAGGGEIAWVGQRYEHAFVAFAIKGDCQFVGEYHDAAWRDRAQAEIRLEQRKYRSAPAVWYRVHVPSMSHRQSGIREN